jgi:hypothetical protein
MSLSGEDAARVRISAAKWLVATGRGDLALPMLEAVTAQSYQLAEGDLAQLAEAWVYFGKEASALELHPDPQGIWWESVVALSKYYHHSITDPAALLVLLEDTRAIEPPKARAARQYGILEPLFAIKAEDAARQTLAYLQDTLLACSAWGKREHRTDGAVQVLLPYLDSHAKLAHDFAAGLMTGTAENVGDFWNIVFVVSGLRWLIQQWAGIEGIGQIVDMLRAWQTGLLSIDS